MAVRIDCPHCGTLCQVPDEHRSKPVRCYKCKQVFSAPPPCAPETEEVPLPDFDVPPEPAPPLPCRLEVGGATSRGRVRARNEDSYLVQQLRWISADVVHEAALLVVADGMGGYQAGDRASRLVIQTAARQLGPLLAASLNESDEDGPDWVAAIDRAIKEANRTVHQQATRDPASKGMGATAALVMVRDREALIGHVGDCRVYHHRGGQVAQVTKDQTLVARMVELQQITPEQALTHPARNEVAQAVGKRADIESGHYRLQLEPGDWLVIACDGLHAHVDEATLQEVLNEASRSARQLARHLVDLADQLGGSDNCTVLAACCY
ncbi:MAG: protein phosphatase 2C domain-containing protein [Planctomycetes bacterium]|nr:protein phosphatase 2C domain-containing protein [Planctomycetota bacterium]